MSNVNTVLIKDKSYNKYPGINILPMVYMTSLKICDKIILEIILKIKIINKGKEIFSETGSIMGKIILELFVALLLLCFCLYNWWDPREKYKRMFDEEKKKINPFNSHTAWGLYAVAIFLIILGVTAYKIFDLMSYIYDNYDAYLVNPRN